MKNIKRLLIPVLLLVSLNAISQILTIGEKDRDGTWKAPDGSIKAEYLNNKISDINSVLNIHFDYDAIIKAAGPQAGLPPELLQTLEKLETALAERKMVLSDLEALARSFDHDDFVSNPAKYDVYINALEVNAAKAKGLEKLDPSIKRRALAITGKNLKYARYYIAAEEVLKELQKDAAGYAKKEGVYVQFGGWLITKHKNTPLHIDGFDDIAPQASFEVNRWQLLPTDEQLQELQRLQQLAKENRDNGLGLITVFADHQLKAIGTTIKEQLLLKVGNLRDEVEAVAEPVPADLRLFISDVKTLHEKTTLFAEQVEERLRYYQNIKPGNVFDLAAFTQTVSNDLMFFQQQLNAISADINVTIAHINALNSSMASLKAKLTAITSNLKINVLTDLNNLLDAASKSATELLNGQKLDWASLEFTTAVYKLAINEIRTEAEFDLYNAGIREDGDRIAFRFVMYGKDKKEIAEDKAEIYLFKVLPSITSSVGIIFADPFRPTSIQTQFQMAPYYNLLFKGFLDKKLRRNSVAYNRVFDWGFGLHVSAPDFDKDDVPELGAGIVISMLHDYLQTGVAYNVFTGDPYWFFGLRLPLPTFSNQ